jgi:predicted ester cyclase
VSKHWLAPTALALLCAGSGWNTTVSAQDADPLDNKLVFAVVVNQIFNQGKLALVGDFMAKDVAINGVPLGRDGYKAVVKDLRTIEPDLKLTVDDVVTQGDRVIGHVTQTGGGTSERRIMLLRINHGLVEEHWSWPAQPGLPGPFDGLEGTRLPAIPAGFGWWWADPVGRARDGPDHREGGNRRLAGRPRLRVRYAIGKERRQLASGAARRRRPHIAPRIGRMSPRRLASSLLRRSTGIPIHPKKQRLPEA